MSLRISLATIKEESPASSADPSRTGGPARCGAGSTAGSSSQPRARLDRRYHDHWGYLIALFSNAAILYRALPVAPWPMLAHFPLYLPCMAALLAWSLVGGARYARWRVAIQAALFVSQPPAWRSGSGAPLLNAAAFGAALLGQSYVGVLALLPFSHAVPLALHIPLQLVSVWAVAGSAGDLCASGLLDNEVSRGFLHSMHSALTMLCLGLPLPMWPHRWEPSMVQCRRIVAFLQVTLGFCLPTLVLVWLECRPLGRPDQRQHPPPPQGAHTLQQQRQRQGPASTQAAPAAMPADAVAGCGGWVGCLGVWHSRLPSASSLDAVLLQSVRPVIEALVQKPATAWLAAAVVWALLSTVIS